MLNIKIDKVILATKAQESAMEGALKSINEFYTKWDSPFRKQIEDHLAQTAISGNFALPDIVGLINQSLTNEIDKIANEAVAKTFIPLVSKFLSRTEKNVKFSDLLTVFLRETGTEIDDASVTVTESKHGWLECVIHSEDDIYEFTIHSVWRPNEEKSRDKRYQILTLPRRASDKSSSNRVMKVCLDGATLEIPFTPNVLQDGFISYLAKLLMFKCEIEMDVEDFNEDMID
jgi:hypothetical protein